MDASILEKEKENITPLVFGRSALKLGKALQETRAPTALSKQREKFECDLLLDESDDPLQVYTDYIAWTHNHFPQGANFESGLLQLLERCTSCFRDTSHYKNDPRYLKVWLEYAGFSDSPHDIFVYLAKKNIGQELALYYEQFASFLELKGLTANAREVYDIGLERNAWPVKRLQRSFGHFKDRLGGQISSQASVTRAPLGANKPLAAAVWSDSVHPMKKQKLAIHHDDSPATLKETVFTQNSFARLNSTVLAVKENRISAKPWAGEVLKQNEESNVGHERRTAKFEVFRDDAAKPENEFDLREEHDEMYTIVTHQGKPTEKICVNMKLLYLSADKEFCLGEILAMSQISHQLKNEAVHETQPQYTEKDQTFTIALRDGDTMYMPRSPTITMMSRMAESEIVGMFNDVAQSMLLDDDTRKEFEDSTSYDGFHTETIHVESQDPESQSAVAAARVATPPTDQYDPDANSSPFLEHP